MLVFRPTLNADVGWKWLVELQFIGRGVAEGADSSSCVSADAGRGAAAACHRVLLTLFLLTFPSVPLSFPATHPENFHILSYFSGLKQDILFSFIFSLHFSVFCKE